MENKRLIEIAKEAMNQAYAPYSKFKTGAALLGKSGKVYTGCNVENISYGLTICAERTAVFKAISEGERDFEKIAVITGSEELVTPCGACRQVLGEFNKNMPVISATTGGKIFEKKLSELLPFQAEIKELG